MPGRRVAFLTKRKIGQRREERREQRAEGDGIDGPSGKHTNIRLADSIPRPGLLMPRSGEKKEEQGPRGVGAIERARERIGRFSDPSAPAKGSDGIDPGSKEEPDTRFDPNELRMGVKVEMEHTRDPEMAKRIVKDHLAKIPDYYTRLLKMEKEAREGPHPFRHGEHIINGVRALTRVHSTRLDEASGKYKHATWGAVEGDIDGYDDTLIVDPKLLDELSHHFNVPIKDEGKKQDGESCDRCGKRSDGVEEERLFEVYGTEYVTIAPGQLMEKSRTVKVRAPTPERAMEIAHSLYSLKAYNAREITSEKSDGIGHGSWWATESDSVKKRILIETGLDPDLAKTDWASIPSVAKDDIIEWLRLRRVIQSNDSPEHFQEAEPERGASIGLGLGSKLLFPEPEREELYGIYTKYNLRDDVVDYLKGLYPAASPGGIILSAPLDVIKKALKIEKGTKSNGVEKKDCPTCKTICTNLGEDEWCKVQFAELNAGKITAEELDKRLKERYGGDWVDKVLRKKT